MALPSDGSMGLDPHTDIHTLSMIVSYNGALFSGFARQEGQSTVQGELEHALELLYRRSVPTVCAGRTDAGVHARGQVVSFDLYQAEVDSRPFAVLQRSVNAITDPAIAIRSIDERPLGFSARFDAVAREYRYFLVDQSTPPIFLHDFSWHVHQPLDVPAMEAAAACLIGEHDFKSFCVTASAVGKSTCRCVREVSFTRETIMGESALMIKVVGNAFLHSMVRTMVGTLVAVGRGKRPPEWVQQVLEARDRAQAGETAPARGLVLWDVTYF